MQIPIPVLAEGGIWERDGSSFTLARDLTDEWERRVMETGKPPFNLRFCLK